jgi:hypothetical protein
VHFESDSLKDKNLECLTCHARSAHRFVPVDSTCAQQGCHLTDDVTIKLGNMTDAVGLHCAVCHEFTAAVPKLATVDSATGTLVPGDAQCFSCHEMKERLKDFDPTRDPHDGKCGMCHNPHSNVKPDDALKSCATAACHGDWRKVEFHTGAAHRKGIEDCETCHTPHAARVDASACATCHERVRGSATGKAAGRAPRALRHNAWSVSALPTRPATERRAAGGRPSGGVGLSGPGGQLRARPAQGPGLHRMPHDVEPDLLAQLLGAPRLPDLPPHRVRQA